MLKKNQTEMMIEMKNPISQMKTTMESLTNRTDDVEISKSGMEEKVEELNHLLKVYKNF